jgi:hypothetical protein
VDEWPASVAKDGVELINKLIINLIAYMKLLRKNNKTAASWMGTVGFSYSGMRFPPAPGGAAR